MPSEWHLEVQSLHTLDTNHCVLVFCNLIVLVPNFIPQLLHQTMHIRICPVHHNMDTCSDNEVMDCDIFGNWYSRLILVWRLFVTLIQLAVNSILMLVEIS